VDGAIRWHGYHQHNWSTFDTVLGVYSGSSVSALTELASDDDDPDTGALTSKVVFGRTSNQTCQIAVDGWGGASGSVQLSVQLGPLVPPQPAPAWVLPDPYGVMVNSSGYTGKVVILDFWRRGADRARRRCLIWLRCRINIARMAWSW